MKKITKVLLIVFLILLAVRVSSYFKASPYAKPEVEVNFTEPEFGKAVVPMQRERKQVAFDQAHQGEERRHSIYSDYSKFASLFGERGFKIKSIDGIKELDADVLVLLAPTVDYTDEEIKIIKDAVSSGTALIILGEAEGAEALNKLLMDFGIIFNRDYIYDLQSYSVLYKYPIISDFKITALEKNVSKIAIYEGCSLHTFGLATSVAFAGKGAKSSTDTYGVDATGLAVAAISKYNEGEIFAICDSDIFSNKFIRNFDNENFARNLINWS